MTQQYSSTGAGLGDVSPPSDPIVDTATNPFKILALSGGGYRGLYTAQVLADLEAHIQAPIASRFDLIAGTSIGGILALALSLEVPAARMVELFTAHGHEIFKARSSLGGIWRSKYTQLALLDLLRGENLFGQKTLGHCSRRVIVPAIDYSNGVPVLFKTPHHPDLTRDHAYAATDVALATSAAPGYFPRHCFDNRQFIDGGLFANAPGLLAVHEAQHYLGAKRDEIHVLSVGTMSSRFTVDPSSGRAGGTLDWGGFNPVNTPQRLFGIAISSQESLVHSMLSHRVKAGQYHHVDEPLTDEKARSVALDKTDYAAQEALIGAARQSSKVALGNPVLRELLKSAAQSPKFYYGPQAVEEGVINA
ncbi:CBASS cGAMP-activated phospholipase [Stenotrophomonas sp. S41]|uniref:CBASS cGAMP-activated phospholipase n=1 Tax=Stenotrophomonas sp. S41 TaxID=2767464 RepID=UPI002D7E4073|nr:CBASS cGAMP-activated phospholipase [Stenotrophomonas sp. S41]